MRYQELTLGSRSMKFSEWVFYQMQQPRISYQTYRMSKAIGIVINEFLERDTVSFSCKNI